MRQPADDGNVTAADQNRRRRRRSTTTTTIIVDIGSSSTNTKSSAVSLEPGYTLDCPTKIDKTNWEGGYQWCVSTHLGPTLIRMTWSASLFPGFSHNACLDSRRVSRCGRNFSSGIVLHFLYSLRVCTNAMPCVLRARDNFQTTVSGATVSVQRKDSSGGWGMKLRFECTATFTLTSAPTPAPTRTPTYAGETFSPSTAPTTHAPTMAPTTPKPTQSPTPPPTIPPSINTCTVFIDADKWFYDQWGGSGSTEQRLEQTLLAMLDVMIASQEVFGCVKLSAVRFRDRD